MPFDLRLIEHNDPSIGSYIAIHEVYTDENGNLNGWSEFPINLSDDCFEGMETLITIANKALLKPILKIELRDNRVFLIPK